MNFKESQLASNNNNMNYYTEMNNYLNNLTNSLITKNLLIDEFSQINKKQRPSILNIDKIKSSYGQMVQLTIDECSSDEGSISDDFEESIVERKVPSLRLVTEIIFDIKTLMNININSCEFPDGVKPGILVKNIDHDMQAIDLKTFILRKCAEFSVDIQVIRIFSANRIKYAYVSFSKIDECQFVFNLLSNRSNTVNLINNEERKIEKNINSVNLASSVCSFSSYGMSANASSGNSQDIFYCYDLTDCKTSYWYGVVLRNLDENCNTEKVKEYCGQISKGVLYSTKPEKVMDTICALVVLNDLDDAEKLCMYLNNQEKLRDTDDKKLKANVHPNSCKIRKNPEKSHFAAILSKSNEDNLSINKGIDNSLNLKKNKHSYSESQMDEIKSVYSGDKSVISSQSPKNNSSKMFFDEGKNNLTKSRLGQLIDNHENYNMILSNEVTPINIKKASEGHSQKIKTNRKISKEVENENKILQATYLKNSVTSSNRSTSTPQLKTNNIPDISELKFSNIFIPPVNNRKINDKNKSKNEEKFSEKKRGREEKLQKHGDSTMKVDKSNRSIQESSADIRSGINQSDNSNSADYKDRLNQGDHENYPSPSIFQIQNSHIISKIKNCLTYNPNKDTLKLEGNSLEIKKSTSYYSSLQKMPGDIKRIKHSLNPKI